MGENTDVKITQMLAFTELLGSVLKFNRELGFDNYPIKGETRKLRYKIDPEYSFESHNETNYRIYVYDKHAKIYMHVFCSYDDIEKDMNVFQFYFKNKKSRQARILEEDHYYALKLSYGEHVLVWLADALEKRKEKNMKGISKSIKQIKKAVEK